MSKGNKCSKCLQRLEEVRNKLANRKDWEVKAKKGDQEEIKRREQYYNNPKEVSITDPCYCAFQVPTQSFGGKDYFCDKCKEQVWLQFNEYEDCPPHVCKEKRCNQCNTSFVELQCPKCNAEQERKNQEQEKLELEQGINYLQSTLKTLKTMKGHPGYSEYTVQQAEKQLAEAKEKYKSKFGELPSSLRDDNDNSPNNREREREREQNCPITKWDTGIRSHC